MRGGSNANNVIPTSNGFTVLTPKENEYQELPIA